MSRDGELFLALPAEPLVGKREIQKLPEFVERVPDQLAVQFRINTRALLGIEQLRAGLGEKMRRFIEPPRSICASGLLGWFFSGSFFCHHTRIRRQ